MNLRKLKFTASNLLLLILISSFLPLHSCRSGKKEDICVSTPAKEPKFVMAQIPPMVTGRDAREKYLAAHYWDNFDFSDTLLLSSDEVVERAWSNYIALVFKRPYSEGAQQLKECMKRASIDSLALEIFTEVSEKYLYDPNSPMRSDEYFIPILEFLLESDKVDDIMKIRPKELLVMAKKNRVGHKAANFKFTFKNGNSSTLYSVGADYTVLFFNNPDCEDCQRVKDYIASSPIFTSLVSQNSVQSHNFKKLAVVSIYSENDIELWRKSNYPSFFINGYDAEMAIERGSLYDLKALPTLYLLDSDKKVVLKDVPIEQIESLLSKL